jgi:hypothetical protein
MRVGKPGSNVVSLQISSTTAAARLIGSSSNRTAAAGQFFTALGAALQPAAPLPAGSLNTRSMLPKNSVSRRQGGASEKFRPRARTGPRRQIFVQSKLGRFVAAPQKCDANCLGVLLLTLQWP